MKGLIGLMLATVLLLPSCAGGNNSNTTEANVPASTGMKFAPKERESSLSASEREDAIAAKKKELADVNIETLLSPHSIRMTILPPAMSGDINQQICEKISMKLLQIASRNGISGVNGSSPIAFAAGIEQKDRTATGTAPQKMIVKYELTYYVLNIQTGDIYASLASDITGVGESFEHATSKAVEEIKDSPTIQKMLTEAETRIISWFNANPDVIIGKVNEAVANDNFGLALALIHSVPEQAQTAFDKISKMEPDVLLKLEHKVAATELAAMKDAIAAANAEYNPEVGAHLAMLPADSPEAKEGSELYDKYLKQIDDARLAKIAAEERERQEQLELEKLRMKYEYEGAQKAAQKDSQNSKSSGGGFFSGLKTFFSGMAASSILSTILSSCLFIL